jgi:hypothetical protein
MATNISKQATSQPTSAPVAPPAFDPAALLAEIESSLSEAVSSRSASVGGSVVPLVTYGSPEILAALKDAGLKPLETAAGYLVRFGGPKAGVNPRPQPCRRRMPNSMAAGALTKLLQSGKQVTLTEIYRMALYVTCQNPGQNALQPYSLIMMISKQDGRAIVVDESGTLAFSSATGGKQGDRKGRFIKV